MKRRPDSRFLFLAALGLALPTVVPIVNDGVDTAEARSRYRQRTFKLAEGVYLTRMFDREGPNRIRVLTIDPTTPVTLDVAPADYQRAGLEATSSIARRHGAIAAVNGDYFESSGRPVHSFVEDGIAMTSPLVSGRAFSLSRDERQASFGSSELSLKLTQMDGVSRDVETLNGTAPDRQRLAAYTSDAGSVVRTPKNACSARIFPAGPLVWGAERKGVRQNHVVDEVVCRYERLARKQGTIIAASRYSEAGQELYAALAPGQNVNLAWSMGRRSAMDVMGGNPNLVENGKVTIRCSGASFCRRHPRTGIGVRADGKVLLVTVDGRDPGRSIGMRPRQFAILFQRLGATWALNFDGGGSTTMVAKDRVVNGPSGGYQRPVGSAVLVLPGADPSEAEPIADPGPSPSPSPTPSPIPTLPADPLAGATVASAVWSPVSSCRGVRDGGSVGGLFDALVQGALPRAGQLSPLVSRTAAMFRGSLPCHERFVTHKDLSLRLP